jgi:hypothetical protein
MYPIFTLNQGLPLINIFIRLSKIIEIDRTVDNWGKLHNFVTDSYKKILENCY